MFRKLVALVLLAFLAACTSNTITAVDSEESRGGGIYTSGG
jgi:hypothetical protein